MSPPEPSVATTLWSVAARHPDRVAVVEVDGRSVTYDQLFAHASRLAHALVAAGLEAGDRVGAWLDDGSEYVALYLACAATGLVVVPLNARYTVHEVRPLLRDSEPRCLVWSAGKDGAVESLRDDGTLDDVLLVRHATDGSVGLDATDLHRTWATGSAERPRRRPVDGLLMIGYTSGTTGHPKGALLTHRSVGAVMRQHRDAYRLVAHSTMVMTGSMSFVSVVPAHVLTHLALAGTLVFPGPWDVDSLLDRLERHRATFTYLPSPVIGDFAAAAARAPQRWASLRSVLHSASKAPAQTLAGLVDVIGPRLVEGWGMTENSGGLMTATSVADLERAVSRPELFATAGRPVPGYDVRAVDDELWVRGPGFVDGYWRRPEATAAAFRDGWFVSGDVGTVDADGFVTVLERRTDLIVSGGMNVYPAEVEAVLVELPSIAEAAVVGAPHDRWGQTVVAVVVPVPGAVVEVDEVLRHCRERLAGYKKPTEVLVVADLPRTPSLKLSRAAVRADVAQTRGASPP